MDKIETAANVGIIGFISLIIFMFTSMGTAEVKVVKVPILDSETGKYYQGYKEVEEFHPLLTIGMIVSLIMMIGGTGLMLWWDR